MAMSLFRLRKSQGSRALELPMAGLKLGTNVLQVRGQDTGLIAALAKIVGLSLINKVSWLETSPRKKKPDNKK